MLLLTGWWCGSGLMSRLFEAVFDGGDVTIVSGERCALDSKTICFDGAYELVCFVAVPEGSHGLVEYVYAVVHGFSLLSSLSGFRGCAAGACHDNRKRPRLKVARRPQCSETVTGESCRITGRPATVLHLDGPCATKN
jgi:hypothetical protein